jgi:flagellar biosynthesis protein FlhF
MNIKRFFGKNSREALSLVRKELGEDAIIISNRSMNGGNEIMAFKEEDMQTTITNQNKLQQTYEDNEPTTLLALINQKNKAQDSVATLPEVVFSSDMTDKTTATNKQTKPAKQESVKRKPVVMQLPPDEPQNQQMPSLQLTAILNEMREMRRSVESQLTTISWSNMSAAKSKLLNKLLDTGFSASISRQIVERLPSNLNDAESLKWIKTVLAKNLNTLESETEVLDQGGIFALIGPTGAGKTTTMAKLAARYVMKHGTQNLGLITTDAYRVGGYEQLRIYGKILGVMVHAVKDEDDLKIALNELKNKHTILIDTVGVSQRDQMVAEQISMLSNVSSPIKRLLCLNATCTGETLADVIRAYKGKGLDGCLITKLDEAATIGSALDTLIREKLKLFYITNGQRVPEDIHMANKQELLEHAFKQSTARSKPFQLTDEELPFVIGNTVNAGTTPQYAEMNYA